ncbi:MAG: flagellar motor protein MotB [Spirochaetaceae bacterium]|jgi:chemotaxis protein MotB|nr:flagellar motor protein MotB [Spirochaetaceae bacterium]
MAKKKKEIKGASSEWLVTYSDMVTLMLCFFVALFNPDDSDPIQLQQMISAFNAIGMGASTGGNTISPGKSADMGNTIMSLPSMDRGRNLGTAAKRAMSLFTPEIKSSKIKITHDERGIVISLASDLFFDAASADINYEDSRNILLRLGSLLNSQDLAGRRFRIEGHTDQTDTDPAQWPSNWELSVARSLAVLHYLADIGVDETRFQVAGFAATMPISRDDTAEGRANNRRVDIVILDNAHL